MMCSLALFPPPLSGDGETSQYNESNTDPSVWFEVGGLPYHCQSLLLLTGWV
jgi:hypothetical protein